METLTAVTLKTGDAAFAVYCLNACKGTNAYERLTLLHRDLVEFRAKAIEQQQTRRGFLNVELMAWLDRRHREISEGLSRYHFRPGISGYSAVGGECRSSLVSITSRKNPEIGGGSFPITEGDVAMALVRLYADGDIGKVRLCETCHNQWRVAAHSNYRFCSKECREQFYKSQPDYHERKRKNQEQHRKRLKRMHAVQDAALKKGK
jgi:hypothetical protein